MDIHLSNIETKMRNQKDVILKNHLIELQEKYNIYNKSIKNSLSKKDFKNTAYLYNEYKKFIQIKNKELKYTSQSKFESTVLESFVSEILISVLLNNNLDNENLVIGGQKNYSKMLFTPKNFKDYVEDLNYIVEVKDQDASISRKIKIKINNSEKEIFVPIVAIECKTYLDKTMLEGSMSTASKIKSGNPYCYFAIITEAYEVGKDIDMIGSNLNQIFVLTKSKRRNKDTEIKYDVIERVYLSIEKHIKSQWFDIEKSMMEEGVILYE